MKFTVTRRELLWLAVGFFAVGVDVGIIIASFLGRHT